MTCRALADFLMDYIDNAPEVVLPSDVRRQFEAHLDECPDCVRYLGQYRDTIRLVTAAGGEALVAMPEDLVRAIVLSVR
jgi:predicted anti-sigma-YlaC factor YlaD